MLADLPFELLSQIASHLDQARQLYHLSLTCHRLHRFVEDSGWRIFVQTCFPSIRTPSLWKEASHALSTASRNWDRRAIIARHIQPSGRVLKWPNGLQETRWQRPTGQKMGFRPAMDSYEVWTGSTWSSRTQVLAFSAGAELVFRIKQSGPTALKLWRDVSPEERRLGFDQHRDAVEWITYKPPEAMQGLDDIMCLKLHEEQSASLQDPDPAQSVVIGTANGRLEALRIPLRRTADTTAIRPICFQTQGTNVRSLDTSGALLAACVSGDAVALFPLRYPSSIVDPQEEVLPLSTVETSPHGGSRVKQLTWAVRFLSQRHLAVGTGPSVKPLSIFQIAESGLSDSPLRQFSCPGGESVLDFPSRATSTSAYQVVPLPESNGSRKEAGDVFLCGFHDGSITAHDMRSPLNHVQTYQDPVDQSAIFSLQAIGRERIVAGGSRHSTVKFFDLRMTGGRAYYHRQRIAMPNSTPRQAHPVDRERSQRIAMTGWNLFLTPREEDPMNRHYQRLRYPGGERGRHGPETRSSPVYSLSVPSACSPSIFAGTENQIVQLDLVSMMDQHPDPIFENCIVRRPRVGDVHVKKTWDPTGDVVNLAMYDHKEAGGVDLMSQTDAGGVLRSEEWVEGYDERWRRSARWKK